MCALFGWLNYKNVVPYKVLKKLTQALANAAEERGTAGETHFAFAHNGVLYNDNELRRERLIPDTHIETDSYAACQLIEQQRKLDFDSLEYMAETVQGNFTFTVLDENNSLYIIKGNNPMCLIHFESLGLYIYASTESIMKNALKRVGMHKFPYDRIEAVEGDIIKIDSKGFLSRSEFEVHYHSKFVSWYDDEEFYTMHEQLLMSYCNCYGVDPDDVALLLDYGYTCDEIEDMLVDHDLLRETIKAIKFEDGESLYEEGYGIF